MKVFQPRIHPKKVLLKNTIEDVEMAPKVNNIKWEAGTMLAFEFNLIGTTGTTGIKAIERVYTV